MQRYDVLRESAAVAQTANQGALQSAMLEYTRALAVLQEVARREPLWSLELNAVLRRTRDAQEEVRRCLALQPGVTLP